MQALSRMLVAVDFSPGSDRAFDLALRLAQRAGAELDVLHVLPVPLFVAPDGPLTSGVGMAESVIREVHEEFARLEAKAGTRALRTHVGAGVPHEEIARAAERLDASVVVLGTHGRTGLARLVIGSVAERVLRTCTTSVLTVPPNFDTTHEGPVCVAYDESTASARALAQAASLGAPLVVVFVDVDPLANVPPRTATAGWETPDAQARRYRAIEREITTAVQALGVVQPRVIVTRGRPADRIAAVAHETAASMIVAGCTGKGAIERLLVGSTTLELVRHAGVPIWVVP